MLVIEALRDTAGNLPMYFLLEQPLGALMRSEEQKSLVDALYLDLAALGYKSIAHTVEDSINYGIPQSRKRVFVVASFNNGTAPMVAGLNRPAACTGDCDQNPCIAHMSKYKHEDSKSTCINVTDA